MKKEAKIKVGSYNIRINIPTQLIEFAAPIPSLESFIFLQEYSVLLRAGVDMFRLFAYTLETREMDASQRKLYLKRFKKADKTAIIKEYAGFYFLFWVGGSAGGWISTVYRNESECKAALEWSKANRDKIMFR